MGMPVTVDVRGAGVDAAALDEVFADLRRLDALFSPYRAGSEVSRIDRGELRPEEASPEVRAVIDLCERYRRATGGWFSAWIDGRFDPSGLVKSWAMDRACGILERHGARDYLIDAGGDVVARGNRAADEPWRVGIRHPVQRDRLVRVVLAADMAVATSGTYEKGAHVRDPRTGQPATEVLSVTVVGADVVEADVHATAALAMGRAGLELVEALAGYEAYAIFPDLTASWTTGFDALCASPAGPTGAGPEGRAASGPPS
jgi:thiamine biosynthesis lipoprotein